MTIPGSTAEEYLFKDLTYKIIGISMNIHSTLGPGFLEIIYKDALELELTKSNIPYQREKEYIVEYNGVILPHRFYADFNVSNKIILEAKACEGGLNSDHLAQTLNYLKVSKCKVGLLINFAGQKLEYKRVVL